MDTTVGNNIAMLIPGGEYPICYLYILVCMVELVLNIFNFSEDQKYDESESLFKLY